MSDEDDYSHFITGISLIITVLTVFSILAKIMEFYIVNLFYAWIYGYDFEFSEIVRKRFNKPSWFIKCNRTMFGRIPMPSILGNKPFLVVDQHGRFIIFARSMNCLRHAEDILDATEFINTEPPFKSYLWVRVLRFIDRWKAGIFVTGKLEWRINNRIPIARILYRLRKENSVDVAIWKDKTIESVAFRPYSAGLFENLLVERDFSGIEREINDTYFSLYYGLLLKWKSKNPWTLCRVLIDLLIKHVKPNVCNLNEYINKYNLVFQLRGHLVRFPRYYSESTLTKVEEHIFMTHPQKFGFLKCFLPESQDLRHLVLNRLLKIAMCSLSKDEFCKMLLNGEMRSTDFHKFCTNYCSYQEHLRISIFRKYDSRESLTFQTYEGKERHVLDDICLDLRLFDKNQPSAPSTRGRNSSRTAEVVSLSNSISVDTRVYCVSRNHTRKIQPTILDRFLNDDSSFII